MTSGDSIDIMHQAVMVAIKLAAPLLLVSMAIGLLIAIIQAATQIHEQTLTFVPKLIIVGVVLVLLAPWMMTTMKDFVIKHFLNVLNFM